VNDTHITGRLVAGCISVVRGLFNHHRLEAACGRYACVWPTHFRCGDGEEGLLKLTHFKIQRLGFYLQLLHDAGVLLYQPGDYPRTGLVGFPTMYASSARAQGWAGARLVDVTVACKTKEGLRTDGWWLPMLQAISDDSNVEECRKLHEEYLEEHLRFVAGKKRDAALAVEKNKLKRKAKLLAGEAAEHEPKLAHRWLEEICARIDAAKTAAEKEEAAAALAAYRAHVKRKADEREVKLAKEQRERRKLVGVTAADLVPQLVEFSLTRSEGEAPSSALAVIPPAPAIAEPANYARDREPSRCQFLGHNSQRDVLNIPPDEGDALTAPPPSAPRGSLPTAEPPERLSAYDSLFEADPEAGQGEGPIVVLGLAGEASGPGPQDGTGTNAIVPYVVEDRPLLKRFKDLAKRAGADAEQLAELARVEAMFPSLAPVRPGAGGAGDSS
jgi:hypothetical protein